jgi:hypothetical protein
MESNIFGVTVRAWLALITVVSGLGFLYIMALFLTLNDIRLTIVTAVIGFINLALGYYLGQKQSGGVNGSNDRPV